MSEDDSSEKSVENTEEGQKETQNTEESPPKPQNEIPGFMVSWVSPEGDEEEGPLTVLWQLIESYKVDIFDVSLHKITSDFIEFVNRSRDLLIEHASSFAVMSARLLFYKSKALLPNPGFEENDPEPRLPPELIQQLLEYRKFQMAAEKLRDIEETSAGVMARETKLTHKTDDSEAWLDVNLVDLVKAYAGVLQKLEDAQKKPDEYEIPMEEYSVEDKMELIQKLLVGAVSFGFEDLFENVNVMNRGEIIATFLAILELTKQGDIVIKQKDMFGEIHIFKKSIVVR